jgi:molybdate transport system substrate-binding protein
LFVFAAASLRELVDEASGRFEVQEGVEVVRNFAGSNILAQQILAAPRADVYISADLRWVDEVEAAGRAVEGSRRNLFSNRLVVVAHPKSPFKVHNLADLARVPLRHLAIADPRAVPAGRYARAHLERVILGDGTLWEALKSRIAPALDVRAALALAASDQEVLAIVYKTDVRASKNVRVLFDLPAIPEVSITYCAVLVSGGMNPMAGRRFLEFLSGREGRGLAAQHGFAPSVGAGEPST